MISQIIPGSFIRFILFGFQEIEKFQQVEHGTNPEAVTRVRCLLSRATMKSTVLSHEAPTLQSN